MPTLIVSGSSGTDNVDLLLRYARLRGFFGKAGVPCVTDPPPCCGSGAAPAGVHLLVQRKRLFLGPGHRLGPSWCVDTPLCDCQESSGSGPKCCGGKVVASVLTLAMGGFSGDWACLSGSFTLVWNGSAWTTGTFPCNGHTCQYVFACVGSSFQLTLFIDGAQFHFAQGGLCDPFEYAPGSTSFNLPGGESQAGNPDITGPADGTGLGMALQLTYQRIYLPKGSSGGSGFCTEGIDCDPAACSGSGAGAGGVDVEVPCCPHPPNPLYPQTLWCVLQNVRPFEAGFGGGFCFCEKIDGLAFPMYWNGSFWQGRLNFCAPFFGSGLIVGVTARVLCYGQGFGGNFGPLQWEVAVGISGAWGTGFDQNDCGESFTTFIPPCPPRPVFLAFPNSVFSTDRGLLIPQNCCHNYGDTSNSIIADVYIFE